GADRCEGDDADHECILDLHERTSFLSASETFPSTRLSLFLFRSKRGRSRRLRALLVLNRPSLRRRLGRSIDQTSVRSIDNGRAWRWAILFLRPANAAGRPSKTSAVPLS